MPIQIDVYVNGKRPEKLQAKSYVDDEITACLKSYLKLMKTIIDSLTK